MVVALSLSLISLPWSLKFNLYEREAAIFKVVLKLFLSITALHYNPRVLVNCFVIPFSLRYGWLVCVFCKTFNVEHISAGASTSLGCIIFMTMHQLCKFTLRKDNFQIGVLVTLRRVLRRGVNFLCINTIISAFLFDILYTAVFLKLHKFFDGFKQRMQRG